MNTAYKKGFTLIELLVVVALIGFIVSILTASITQAQLKSVASTSATQVRRYEIMIREYLLDNNTFPLTFPVTVCIGPASATCKVVSTVNGLQGFVDLLAPYTRSMPEVKTGLFFFSGNQWQGATYSCVYIDPNSRCTRAQITWPQAGTKCLIGANNSDGVNSICQDIMDINTNS